MQNRSQISRVPSVAMTEPRNVQSDVPADKGRASNGGALGDATSGPECPSAEMCRGSSENLAAPSPLDRGRSMSPVQTSTTAARVPEHSLADLKQKPRRCMDLLKL